jgi:predicted flavoprotein YhiN
VAAYDIIKDLGLVIDEPIPSLFTLNFPNETIKKDLQGISVQNAQVKIANSKLNYNGPVLITHWGLSGPAVLKLSAFAAKEFFELHYKSKIFVNWVFPLKPNEVEIQLKLIQKEKHKAKKRNNCQRNNCQRNNCQRNNCQKN